MGLAKVAAAPALPAAVDSVPVAPAVVFECHHHQVGPNAATALALAVLGAVRAQGPRSMKQLRPGHMQGVVLQSPLLHALLPWVSEALSVWLTHCV